MPDILIRGLNSKVLNRLKARAKRHGRSLQGEARQLLEQAAGDGPEQITALLDDWKRRLAGRRFISSAKLLREDRRR